MQVLHIPQIHKHKRADGNRRAFEVIARSQHRIALALQKNPSRPVFVEGNSRKFTPRVYEVLRSNGYRAIKLAERVFPGGRIPQSLNRQQKRMLVRYGAALTLFHLGVIKRLHKTADRGLEKIGEDVYKKYRRNFGQLGSCFLLVPGNRLFSLKITRREQVARDHLNAFKKRNPHFSGAVHFIYGGGHNFLQYKNPIFKIHPDFLTAYRQSKQRFKRHVRNCEGMTMDMLKGILYPLWAAYRSLEFFFG